MKGKLVLFTGFVLALLTAGYLYNKYRIAPVVEFSNLALRTIDGQQVTLKDYESRYMLVCFAATWCSPCIQEIPSLIGAQEQLAENDVAVIIISDESEAAVNTLWQKTGRNLPVLRSEKAYREIDIATLPTTYLLNEKREIVFKKTGAEDWASAAMIEKLKGLAQ